MDVDRRDALHAVVRRLCGARPVNRALILEDAALVEYEKGVVLVALVKGKVQRVYLNDEQARTICRTLCDIYE